MMKHKVKDIVIMMTKYNRTRGWIPIKSFVKLYIYYV